MAIWIVLFLFVPLGIIFTFSFYENTPTGFLPNLTLENYLTVFNSATYTNILAFTVGTSLLITVASLVLGYPVAYFLAMKIRNDNTRLMLILILIVPFWIDFTTKLMAWFPILGSRGIINYALLSAGLVEQPIDAFILSPTAAIIVMTQTYMLFMIAPILLGLGTVDPFVFQAAESLGAGRFQIFRHVTLPLSRPGIVIGSAFVFVMAMGDFVTPRVLGGAMQTIGLLVALQAGFLNWPLAGALATVLIGISLVVVFLLFKLVNIGKMVF